jgi:hypothetical protein
MKKNSFLKLWTLVLGLSILSTSCQNENESPVLELDETNETAQETDLMGTLEDIDEVILVAFQRNGFADRTTLTLEEDLCNRTNISWLPAQKKMIIDFGEGCTSPGGVIRKGKIIVSYTGRYWVTGTVITTTFENYYVDGKKFEGIREVRNDGIDLEETFFTFSATLKNARITWKDGSTRAFESRHIKRIYLPSSERGIIYAVTGGSKGLNRSKKPYTAVIAKPLIFSERCINTGIKIPSKGILELDIENRNQISIDFGNGGCDREAIISIGDRTKTILLPRS